jgi:tetratricopeptide (TPR) repeat protein
MDRLKIWWHFRLAVWEKYRGLRSYKKRYFQNSEMHFSEVLAFDAQHLGAWIGRGIVRWRELDDFMGAIDDFNHALRLSPSHAPEILFYRSMAYSRGGNYHAAISDFERILDIAPRSRFARDAYAQLASLYAIISELPDVPDQLSTPTVSRLTS